MSTALPTAQVCTDFMVRFCRYQREIFILPELVRFIAPYLTANIRRLVSQIIHLVSTISMVGIET